MIRLALVIAALPAIAHADETCHFSVHGSSATIRPGAETFAEIEFRNLVAARVHKSCDLTIFGATMTVHYGARMGRTPDTISITVPPAFVAEPPEQVIDDNDSFTFLIHLDAMQGF